VQIYVFHLALYGQGCFEGLEEVMSQPEIRKVLKACPDGLTITAIVKHTGKDPANLTRMLTRMDDVYIDRWTETSRGVAKYTPVYVLIDVPEDAPRPE
jgi:hypothetical protein